MGGHEFEQNRIQWRTGKPGVLQSTGLQRAAHEWPPERQMREWRDALEAWAEATCGELVSQSDKQPLKQRQPWVSLLSRHSQRGQDCPEPWWWQPGPGKGPCSWQEVLALRPPAVASEKRESWCHLVVKNKDHRGRLAKFLTQNSYFIWDGVWCQGGGGGGENVLMKIISAFLK